MCQTVSASKAPLTYLAFKPEQFVPGKGLISLVFHCCNILQEKPVYLSLSCRMLSGAAGTDKLNALLVPVNV